MNIKKHIGNVVTTVYIFLFSLSASSLYAFDDDDPGFPTGDDPGKDLPQTPIDDWVPFMLVLGVGLVVYYSYKQRDVKQ